MNFSRGPLVASFLAALAALDSDGRAAPQALGSLVGYWKLDETAVGTAADSSGWGNGGTHQNNPTPDTVNVATLGFANPASLSLDAAAGQQHVLVPDAASLRLTTTLTLAAWVRPTANTGTGDPVEAQKCIVEKWLDSAGIINGYFLRLTANNAGNNVPYFSVGDGSQQASASPSPYTPLTLNTWNHVAGTFNGTQLILYVNGVASPPTASTAAPLATNTAELHIGKDYGANVFTGNIDDVRVYNRVLSAAEITDLVNGVDVRDPVIPPPTGGSSGEGKNGDDWIGDWCFGGSAIPAPPNPVVFFAALMGLALLLPRRRS